MAYSNCRDCKYFKSGSGYVDDFTPPPGQSGVCLVQPDYIKEFYLIESATHLACDLKFAMPCPCFNDRTFKVDLSMRAHQWTKFLSLLNFAQLKALRHHIILNHESHVVLGIIDNHPLIKHSL